MAEHRKYLIDDLTGSKSGIEQARSWLVQHPEEAPGAARLLLDDLKTVKSYARCLNVLYDPLPPPSLPPSTLFRDLMLRLSWCICVEVASLGV